MPAQSRKDTPASPAVTVTPDAGTISAETTPEQPATAAASVITDSVAEQAPAAKSPAELAREQAAQYFAEKRYREARKALEEAEHLEAESLKHRAQRVIGNLRAKLPKRGAAEAQPAAATEHDPISQVDQAIATVNSYSKIAAGVGLLPGGLLNFAGILAVQVTMVWKIANQFGRTEGKDRIRGSILSLIGSLIPGGIGHSAAAAIAAIPALIAGTVVYFVVTPVLAYAMTQAVGKVFIMHFESGGTLLTFDPKAFANYFMNEFKKAGGVVTPEAQPDLAGTAA